MTRIVRQEVVPGGAIVTVETPGAFTNGDPRVETVFLSRSELIGRTREEIIQSVRDEIGGRGPLDDVVGVDLAAPPTETKQTLERKLDNSLADFMAWQFRLDHVSAYGLGAAQTTALTNALTKRRDAAAARDLELLQRWRAK